MLSNLLTIGKSALNTAQAWVSVTGDNIANADTAGYTRRYVVQKEASTITVGGNQLGLGSNAEQVLRYFDKFLEDSYIDEETASSRWAQYDNIMESLESIFNEANTTGLSDTLNNFLNAWQKLALSPDDPAVRTSVLTHGQTLSDMFKSMYGSVSEIQNEMNVSISKTVERINEITKTIAGLNKEISETSITEVINPNGLFDQRDALVEELSTLIDIKTIDGGDSDYRVQLATGQPLVDNAKTYDLAFYGAKAENRLTPESNFAGSIEFNGTDEFEYTIEVVKQGALPDYDGEGVIPETAPLFRVSLDGGKTWLKNPDGTEKHFPVTKKTGTTPPEVNPISVKDITVSFSFDSAAEGEAITLLEGDAFTIVPKTGLYWIEPTRGPENITPQIAVTGADNRDRVTGGKITSYFSVRDDASGRYMDELDALAKSVAWEVNHLYSQGSGLTKMTQSVGQVPVEYYDKALGTALSGNTFYDRLEKGSVNIYFYDKTTGENISSGQLLFPSETDASLAHNFDPSVNTLNDVVAAFENITVPVNGSSVQAFEADIQNGRLTVKMRDGVDGVNFAFGEDSSGLLAALGLNSFFAGNSASSLEISTDINNDYTKINAGRVNGGYEVNEGDNTIAAAIGDLATKTVTISTFWKTSRQSLPDYYASLVSTVGSDKLHSKTNNSYHATLRDAMLEQKESLSGVNLDEEMTNLVKYQSAYTAAAKLITTADEMLGVLIGLKQ